jgi:hypothetical protein
MRRTQEAPDYPTIALENRAEMELKRGLNPKALDRHREECLQMIGEGGA